MKYLILVLILFFSFPLNVVADDIHFDYESEEIKQGIYFDVIETNDSHISLVIKKHSLPSEVQGFSFDIVFSRPVSNYSFSLLEEDQNTLVVKKELELVNSYAFSSINNNKISLGPEIAIINFDISSDTQISLENTVIALEDGQYLIDGLEEYGGMIRVNRELPLAGIYIFMPYIFSLSMVALFYLLNRYKRKNPEFLTTGLFHNL